MHLEHFAQAETVHCTGSIRESFRYILYEWSGSQGLTCLKGLSPYFKVTLNLLCKKKEIISDKFVSCLWCVNAQVSFVVKLQIKNRQQFYQKK